MILHVALAVVLLLSAVRLYFGHKYWTSEGRKLQKSGYLPPAPSWFARAFFRLVNRLLVFFSIGPVKVIGRENLRRYKGRLLVTPNHIQPPDWALVNQGVHYERYTAAAAELKGSRGLFSAWTGCFGVDPKQPGGAEAFVNSCVEVLASRPNASLLYFPQGKLVADNVLRPEDFRPGAIRVVRRVEKQLNGQPIAVLPVAILYKQGCCQTTWFHRLMLRFGQKWFRNLFGTKNARAVVVIGKPIPVDQLPADADPEHPATSTEFLRQRIQELLDIAERN